MIEIRQIKHIKLLAKYKNFSKAAEVANITQPALSISIKKAEEYFGNILFSRKSKMIELTAQGEIALEVANTILESLERGRTNIININNLDKGLVKFGVDNYIAKSLVPNVVKNINKEHPNISFDINVNSWYYHIESLRKENIDFFITIYNSASDFPDLDLRKEIINFPTPHYYARRGHPLTKKEKVVGSDIGDYPWVGNLASPTYGKWIMEATGTDVNSLTNPFLAEVNSSGLGIELIKNSDAVGAAPLSDIIDFVNKGMIEVLDVNWAIPHPENVGLIVSLNDRDLAPASKLLISMLKECSEKFI